jgi:predicted MFS family arabinose efflux permease
MRWRMLALLFLARVALGVQFQAMASVGDEVAVAFGLDYAGIGLLIGLFMAPGLVLSLPAGAVGRFLSDRALAALGLSALALGGVLSALAHEAWTIGAGRVLSGAGFLFSTLYFTKMVADWFDGREIATAMSVLVTSWPLGIALAQVLNAVLLESFAWPVPFFMASGYCLLNAFTVFVFYRPPEKPSGGTALLSDGLSAREWQLIICAGFVWAVFNGGYVVYLSFGPGVLEEFGLSPVAAAATISLGSWATLLSFAICGYLTDRFGGRNLVLTLCTFSAVAALGLICLPGGGMAGSLLLGCVGMAPAGVIMALAGKALRPQNRAFGMGIFFSIYYAVMLLVPLGAGVLLDATGDPQTTMIFGAILFASMLPVLHLYRRLAEGTQPASA